MLQHSSIPVAKAQRILRVRWSTLKGDPACMPARRGPPVLCHVTRYMRAGPTWMKLKGIHHNCPQQLLVKWGLSKLPPTSQVGSIQILLTKGTPKVIENGVVVCVCVCMYVT